MTVEEQLLATIKSLQETNRSLNRRANALESPWRSEVERMRAENEMWRDCWHREFKRVGDAFDYIKQIYEVCAAKVGKPYGSYHSVNDCSHRENGEPYTVRAAVYHDRQAHVFKVLDVVKEAVQAEDQRTRDTDNG